MYESSVTAGGPRGRRIRVLLTMPPASRAGGVTQYLRALGPHLRNDVECFTVGSQSDNEHFGRVVSRVVRDSLRFAGRLRRGDHQVVHLNPSIGSKALLRDGILLLIAKALRKTVVVLAHGWDEACERALATRLSRVFQIVYGRADAFIVLGNEFKNKLRRLGYEGTVFVQGAPIDDDLLADCRRRQAQQSSAGRSSQFNILFLARVEKEKGIYEALETYRIVKQQHPFVSLTVAGDGSELASAVRLARDLNLSEAYFVGHVEGAAKCSIFRAANCYLFPSHTEGLPISVLEAMAYGLPIVTCAVGGLRDFFQDGRMGFIADTRNPEVFASLLRRLISDPDLCSGISLFNRKYARDHFTAQRVAAQLEQVYRFVLEGPDRALLRAA